MTPPPPEREIGHELIGAVQHSSGAYELVVGAIAAAAVGFSIDWIFGLTPLFTLLFAVTGFIGAGYSLWLRYRTEMQTVSTERNDRRNGDAA